MNLLQSRSFFSLWMATFFVFFQHSVPTNMALSTQETWSTSTTCTIMGTLYNVGETILGFETRCGSAADFPCYCDPTQDPPISCPYCSFALPNGEILCLYEGETQTFTDIDSQRQTCTCNLDDETDLPVSQCEVRPGLTVSQTSSSNDTIHQAGSDTCTIDMPDGTIGTFSRGESIGDSLTNRCGSDFPCYCNPDFPGSIECPYCRFPTQGGDLLCAGDGETVEFIDLNGREQVCSCDVPSDPSLEPMSSCEDSAGGSSVGDNDNNDSSSSNNNDAVCTLELESGQIITFVYGESYGDHVQNRCGSSTDFPCYCNPELSNQMECPYCGFVQGNGELLCATHQDVVSFNDGQNDQTCTCEIPIDPFAEPIQNCQQGNMAPPTPSPGNGTAAECTIADPNGNMVNIPHGESFGNLVEGVCGDSDQWPAFCNTELANTVVSRTGSQDSDTIEYPYCVYTDTISGETICARNDEQVTYMNFLGEKVQCTCSYDLSDPGGNDSTCEPVNEDFQQPSSEPATDPPQTSRPVDPLPNAAASPSGISTSATKAVVSLLLLAMLSLL